MHTRLQKQWIKRTLPSPYSQLLVLSHPPVKDSFLHHIPSSSFSCRAFLLANLAARSPIRFPPPAAGLGAGLVSPLVPSSAFFSFFAANMSAKEGAAPCEAGSKEGGGGGGGGGGPPPAVMTGAAGGVGTEVGVEVDGGGGAGGATADGVLACDEDLGSGTAGGGGGGAGADGLAVLDVFVGSGSHSFS